MKVTQIDVGASTRHYDGMTYTYKIKHTNDIVILQGVKLRRNVLDKSSCDFEAPPPGPPNHTH